MQISNACVQLGPIPNKISRMNTSYGLRFSPSAVWVYSYAKQVTNVPHAKLESPKKSLFPLVLIERTHFRDTYVPCPFYKKKKQQLHRSKILLEFGIKKLFHVERKPVRIKCPTTKVPSRKD